MSNRTRLMWAIANAAGLVVALCLNGLANALPLNGITTGALSDRYPNLFVPMGATFSIWALIYTGLLAFVVYGAVLVRSDRARTPLDVIGPWFVVNMLANAAWIVAWHWMQVPLSLGIMTIILGSLLAMYRRLGVGVSIVPAPDRWLVHAPISVYVGWISVATIANVTALAVDLGAPAFGTGPAVATVCMLAVAVALAARMLWAHRDALFALVVAWALLGIHLKRAASEAAGSPMVAGAALAGLGLLGVALGLAAVRARRTRPAHIAQKPAS